MVQNLARAPHSQQSQVSIEESRVKVYSGGTVYPYLLGAGLIFIKTRREKRHFLYHFIPEDAEEERLHRPEHGHRCGRLPKS